MKRTLSKLSAFGLAIVALLSACQKEEHPGRLELTAEGLGNETKMTVAGVESYWQTGDKVNINGEEASISIAGSGVQIYEDGVLIQGANRAYVDGSFSSDQYCIVFPSEIFQSRMGNIVTVNMPSVYHYNSAKIINGNGEFGQVLNAPLAYLGTAADGKVQMKHLTGALNVQINGPSGIYIDKITVSTTQNRVISGPMQIDLSDLENFGVSETNPTTNNTITMIGGTIGTVQIPIPVLEGIVNFSICVEGHKMGTKYTFERTQVTGGHLGRGVIATVAVDLNEGQPGVTVSALFPSVTLSDLNTYYEIRNATELRLVSEAVWAYSYEGQPYREANYLVMNDIDMSDQPFTSITGLKGIFNGSGHTISNMTVTGAQYNRDYTYLAYNTQFGVFAMKDNNEPAHICNITFHNLTLNANSYISGATYQDNVIGGLFGFCPSGVNIENVHITNLRISNRFNDWGHFYVGGFFGRMGDNISISNSSISFAPDQPFCLTSESGTAYVGGISGYGYNGTSGLHVNNVTIDFGTMSRSCNTSFGGISGLYLYNAAAFSRTTVIGNITVSGSANYITPESNNRDGVDISGLIINN